MQQFPFGAQCLTTNVMHCSIMHNYKKVSTGQGNVLQGEAGKLGVNGVMHSTVMLLCYTDSHPLLQACIEVDVFCS